MRKKGSVDMENDELTQTAESAIIEDTQTAEPEQRAGAAAPEDTRYGVLQAEIANQRDIIAALQEQNASYAKQIAGLIRNGANVTPPNERASEEDIAQAAGRRLPQDYVPLRELDLDMSPDKVE